jgi:hypothetical protein
VVINLYPKRPQFFAHEFCRLMGKVCLGADIGPETCWLLAYIVNTEDAAHYRRPVSFFNDDLATRTGLSLATLKRVRERAVEAGWLCYEPGAKGRAARYFVMVPPWADGLDDGPGDERPGSLSGGMLAQVEPASNENRARIAPQCEPHSSLSLAPSLSAADSTSAVATATKPAAKTKPAPREKKPRPRNPLFDAIANVTGLDPATAGGFMGTASAALASANPPYTPADVAEFGRRFLDLCPYARGERDRPTVGELQKYIGLLRAGPSPGRATAPRLASLGEALALDNGEIHPPAPSR